ncbi:elongin-A-like [Engystomops pustulosus]|uniref:elongin-A-like n=1 Tax=Engystomops pustulosus TaxID=76066 RepID=UPI003AFB5EA1
MNSQSVVQRVQQLKDRLGHTQDPKKISKTLKNLQELNITLDILVETGVGKTVNSFRKHSDVGDFAKSIVLQWKKLVPEVKELEDMPNPRHEIMENKKPITHSKQEKEDILEDMKNISKSKPENKAHLKDKRLSKAKPGQNEILEEVNLNSKGKPPIGGKNSESQKDNPKLNESHKTEDRKVHGQKKVPKEKTPDKNSPCKEKTHSNSQSRREKSTKSKHEEKIKDPHLLSTEKKSKYFNKETDKHPGDNKVNKKATGTKEANKSKTEGMLSSEEFDAPTMSFESYLNYDQVSNKRKKKSYPVNEPPKKIEKVCKQYCNVELSKTLNQCRETYMEEVDNTEVKKHCLEDLLNVPLPKILTDCSIFPSPPHTSECKESIPEILPEMSPESSGFTGRRLNSKMLVYSGSKVIYLPKMLSLYEQCIRVLQNNIDSIQEVGGVPFEILKPVLNRCTPEQLNRIEECNPVFMEDSGNLWKKHCERDFKGHRLLEYESWREMYLRLFNEREEKLRKITQNISSAHCGKPKGRQVKLAYIHGAAKPPRNIRRQQEIYGTAGPIVQPHPLEKYKLQKMETKESSASTPHSNVVPINNISVPVSNSQFGQSQDQKRTIKKIAPMMAKSMRAFKNRVGPR